MNAFSQLIQFLLRLFSGSNSTASSKPGNGPKPKPSPSATEGAAPEKEPDPAPTEPPPEKEADPVLEPLEPLPVTVKEVSRSNRQYVHVAGGSVEVKFRKHKKGLYTVGQNRAADFIEAHRAKLANLHLSDSAMRVMFPVSENEGNLDAINTWDNSFLTFGMFQWTIGARENQGELPALLRKIKDREPRAFQEYFGQYGLDVSEDTGAVYGFLTLNGVEVRADSRKEQFRSPEWSFRFWHAGQDPRVMAIEVEHAISRLKTFYWKMKYEVAGRPMAEVITSEYGVALILDNHVNRPGYVDNCLRLAAKETGLAGKDPAQWSNADELALIEAYLRIRETYGKYPMTHAAKRGQVTRRYVDEGRLSADRGSFVYEAGVGGRGTDPTDLIGLAPSDYRERAYTDIEHFDKQVEERGVDLMEEVDPEE